MSIEKKSIIKFLLGEDSYDGYWYGDEPHDKRPKYWWRTKLREEIESATVSLPENELLHDTVKKLHEAMVTAERRGHDKAMEEIKARDENAESENAQLKEQIKQLKQERNKAIDEIITLLEWHYDNGAVLEPEFLKAKLTGLKRAAGVIDNQDFR